MAQAHSRRRRVSSVGVRSGEGLPRSQCVSCWGREGREEERGEGRGEGMGEGVGDGEGEGEGCRGGRGEGQRG